MRLITLVSYWVVCCFVNGFNALHSEENATDKSLFTSRMSYIGENHILIFD